MHDFGFKIWCKTTTGLLSSYVESVKILLQFLICGQFDT